MSELSIFLDLYRAFPPIGISDHKISGLSELTVLHEVKELSGSNVNDLSAQLSLNLSTIIGLAEDLSSFGFVSISNSGVILKTRKIYITNEGRRAVDLESKGIEKKLNKSLKCQSVNNIHLFIDLIHEIADLFQIHRNYKSSFPLLNAILRLFEASGFISGKIFGTKYGASEWHILNTIRDIPGVSLSQLQQIDYCDMEKLNRTLVMLTDKSLLNIENGFTLSGKGKDVLKEIAVYEDRFMSKIPNFLLHRVYALLYKQQIKGEYSEVA